jgi:hypothetical protein
MQHPPMNSGILSTLPELNKMDDLDQKHTFGGVNLSQFLDTVDKYREE